MDTTDNSKQQRAAEEWRIQAEKDREAHEKKVQERQETKEAELKRLQDMGLQKGSGACKQWADSKVGNLRSLFVGCANCWHDGRKCEGENDDFACRIM